MLRVKDDSPRQALSRLAAVLLFAVLIGGAVAVSALRGSAQQPADVRIQVKEANTGSLIFGAGVNSDSGLTGSIALNERNFNTAAPPADNSRRPPFDLSYLPSDIAGVVAVRPAEFFRQPGAGVLVGPISTVIAEEFKEFSFPGEPVLRLDAIEQIVGWVNLTYSAKAPKGSQNQLILSPSLIRTEKSFDWKERMRTVVPDAKEIPYRGKSYFKGKTKIPALGSDMCYCIPDDRTLVLQSETTIRHILDGQKGGPAFADWQRVERRLFAVAVDMHRMEKIIKKEGLPPQAGGIANLVFAADLHDSLTLRAFVTCIDNKTAEALVTAVTMQIAGWENERGSKAASITFVDRLSQNLLKHARVERHGSEISMGTQAAIDFAELGKLMLPPK